MNRRGFTLVELLAVIVIIGLVGGIATIFYNSFQTQTVKKVFVTYMDNMRESTIMYFLDNPTKQPTSSNPTKTLYLSDGIINFKSNSSNIFLFRNVNKFLKH